MRKFKKRSKRQGKYKSQLEASVAKRLGKRGKYEPVRLRYVVSRAYAPDFLVDTDGGPYLLEVKGYLRYEDQAKMRAVKECNPEVDLRFYFPKNNKVMGSKMTNSEWCEKYGFKYTIGRFPRGW